MGGGAARGFPNQVTVGSIYRDHNLPKLEPVVHGRRTMPGGPLLPRVPNNPFAIKASRIGRALNSPAQWPPEQ